MATYRLLASNTRYLKGLSFDGSDSTLTDADRTNAEWEAWARISTELGIVFADWPATPPIVAVLGGMLGAAEIYDHVAISKNFGPEDEGAKKPAYLRKQAQKIIDDLRSHRIGIMAADGTYPFAQYPAPSILPTIGVGGAKPVSIVAGLEWGQMAQARITDQEKLDLDTSRGRLAFDAEAAYAGAYGV